MHTNKGPCSGDYAHKAVHASAQSKTSWCTNDTLKSCPARTLGLSPITRQEPVRVCLLMLLGRTDDDAHGAAGARVVGHRVTRQQLAAVVARRVLEALVVGDALLAGLRGPCTSVSTAQRVPEAYDPGPILEAVIAGGALLARLCSKRSPFRG